jgi:hypothetical protein
MIFPVGLCHWFTLESWLGMVIDAVLIKAIESSEEEEPTIIVNLLGNNRRVVDLVLGIQELFVDALNAQAVEISSKLISKTSALLRIATHTYHIANRSDKEGPTSIWLRHYLCRDIPLGTYKAWDSKDLVWAIYSYFL